MNNQSEDPKIFPRKPWLAGVLQFLSMGLGHVYCGQPLRGLAFFMISVAINLVVILGFISLPATLNLIIPAAIELAAIFDAIRCAGLASLEYRLARYNRWYFYVVIWIGTSFFGALNAGFIKSNVAQAFGIPSESMEPTILNGDHVMVNMAVFSFRQPERGDLVIFRMPSEQETPLIKRIIGLPSETIEIRNESVFIDGKMLRETYKRVDGLNVNDPSLNFFAPTKIPDRTYFVMGDNRENSLDSRDFGPVPKDRLLGLVRMIYFSIVPDSWTIRWNRFGRNPE
jgi:signal peptidase I